MARCPAAGCRGPAVPRRRRGGRRLGSTEAWKTNPARGPCHPTPGTSGTRGRPNYWHQLLFFQLFGHRPRPRLTHNWHLQDPETLHKQKKKKGFISQKIFLMQHHAEVDSSEVFWKCNKYMCFIRLSFFYMQKHNSILFTALHFIVLLIHMNIKNVVKTLNLTWVKDRKY